MDQFIRYCGAMLLEFALARFIRVGRLGVIDATGRRHLFEGSPGPSATIRLHDPALHRKVLLRPRLFVGEAYMDGSLTIEEGSLYDFIDVLVSNDAATPRAPIMRLERHGGASCPPLPPVQPGPPRAPQRRPPLRSVGRALRAVPRPRPAIFLRLFPLAGRRPRHRPGQQEAPYRGQAAAAAGAQGARYRLGLGRARALSRERIRRRRDRAHPVRGAAQGGARGAPPRRASPTGCGFICAITARRPVATTASSRSACSSMSASTITATFFRKLSELLAPDGVALLHSIGRMDGPGTTNPWLRKYIFPGGYSPALSEVLPRGRAERAVDHRHRDPAPALRRDAARLAPPLRATTASASRALYDERFCRMWEIYLVGCRSRLPAPRITWSSRCRWRRRWMPCR